MPTYTSSALAGLRLPRRMLLAAALIAGALPAAHAKETASASTLITITYALTDLAPNDGIGPSYTVPNGGYFGRYGTGKNLPGFWEGGFDVQPFSTSDSNGASTAAASVTGDLHTSSGLTVSASTAATDFAWRAQRNGQQPEFGYASARADFEGMLSAHTSITFHVDYTQDVQNYWRNEHATSDVMASATSSNNDWFMHYSAITFVEGAHGGSLNFTIDNPFDEGLRTTFSTQAIASSSSEIALEVPEPSTYAMLSAGLALVAWRARRTKRLA